GSSISYARSWTVSARRTQTCVATSFLALSRSNSRFSKPPIRPDFLLRTRHRSGLINGTWEIHGCNRLSGQGCDGRLRGTDGSNPPPSIGESANHRFRRRFHGLGVVCPDRSSPLIGSSASAARRGP